MKALYVIYRHNKITTKKPLMGEYYTVTGKSTLAEIEATLGASMTRKVLRKWCDM